MLDTLRSTKKARTYIFFFMVCAFFVCALPSTTRAEYINSFTAEYTIQKDAAFTAVEQIDYFFTSAKHGIYRCIPTIHGDKPASIFKERYIELTVDAVTMDGGAVPYTVDSGRSETCVKIGDADRTISGAHAYEIRYTVGGAFSYEEYGGADFYWNVTGHEWTVPILKVEARLSASDPIFLRERSCYRGPLGEANSCKGVTQDGATIIFSDALLGPGEGVTIAQALDRSNISEDIRERYNVILLGLILGMLCVIVFGIAVYRYKTRFDTDAPIIPQYEPYPGVKPMYAGFLFDKRLDPRDITAGIVYLAQQGFIKIKKIDRKVLFFFEVDDYELTLLKDMDELPDAFEREILKLVFSEYRVVNTSVTLSDLKNDQTKGRENYYRLSALSRSLTEDLKKHGYWVGIKLRGSTAIVVGVPIAIVVVFSFIAQWLMVVGVALLILALVFFGTGRRTRKGYEALDHLKGFKQFLSVTETQRYIFHNAPEKNAEQFMEYLPYAIAFGVEKQWAKTFEGITIPNPNWYDGGSVGGSVGSFNATALTQSLGGFSTAFASSSGASGSASSGGGSSGGGSGGGGGGSW